jgi:hypothetical protein
MLGDDHVLNIVSDKWLCLFLSLDGSFYMDVATTARDSWQGKDTPFSAACPFSAW